MSALLDTMVLGVKPSTDLSPAGYVLIWRSPKDLRLSPEAQELLSREPRIPAPQPPLPHAALKRAVAKLVRGETGHFVRQAGDGSQLVVRQRDTEDKHDFDVRLTAAVNILGQLEALPVTDDEGDALDDDIARGERLTVLFGEALACVTAPDITLWLKRYVLPACQATSIHTSAGGAYFVPAIPAAVDALTRVRKALSMSGHDLLVVLAAYDSDPAVCGAVLESLAVEVSSFVASVDPAELGAKALDNRKVKCEALRARVAEFARLLNAGAPELLATLDNLDFELVIGNLRPDSPT